MCPRENVMRREDKETMRAYAITCAPRNVYFYKGFKYDRLDDAVRYAEIDARPVRKFDSNS